MEIMAFEVFKRSNVTFTRSLFDKLYDQFWKHVYRVQIKTSSNMSIRTLTKRTDAYNRQENAKTALSLHRKPSLKMFQS